MFFKNVFDIAFLYLHSIFRRRDSIVLYFFIPLLFTFLLGRATEENSNSGGIASVVLPLAILNQDSGQFGQTLIQRLQEEANLTVTEVTTKEEGLNAVRQEESIAFLIIPPDFTNHLKQNLPLDFYVDPVDTISAQSVEQLILEAVGELNSSLDSATVSTVVAEELGLFSQGDQEREAYFEAAIQQAQFAWHTPPITIHSQIETPVVTTGNDIPAGHDQASPGMLTMFTMLFMLGGATALVTERNLGTLRRLFVMPVSKASIIMGKMTGIYLSGLIQIAILILAGIFLFGVQWGRSPFALVAVILGFTFAVSSLSLLMATLTSTAAQVNAISTLIVLSLAALGGAWWPLEIVPAWMQTIGKLSPVSWAMAGFQDVISRGLDITAVLPEVAVLSAFGLVFLVISIAQFKYD